jgi:hypothetical protein
LQPLRLVPGTTGRKATVVAQQGVFQAQQQVLALTRRAISVALQLEGETLDEAG